MWSPDYELPTDPGVRCRGCLEAEDDVVWKGRRDGYIEPTRRGRTVEEWKLRVDGLDNHWLDGVVGCAVAASIQGVELPQMKVNQPQRRRVTFAEMQRNRGRRYAVPEIRENP